MSPKIQYLNSLPKDTAESPGVSEEHTA